MAFQIPCLLFLVVLFFVKTEGSKESCNNTTHIFKDVLNICCKKCEPGFHMISECSAKSETVCAPCPSGKWSRYNYYKNCFKCTTCENKKGLKYAQKCSATRDAKCTCLPGRYCSWGYEEPYCSEQCKLYTLCPPGQGIVIAGTASANVKCEDCPSGTFSDQQSSTQKCQAFSKCGPGGVLQEGSATSDAVCNDPIDLVDPSSGTTQKAPTQKGTTQKGTTQGTTPNPPNRAGDITPSTGPQSVISVPSNGTSGITDITVIAPLVAFCGAFLFVVSLVGICYFKNRRGPPEKETKVENGCLKVALPPSPSHPECQLLLNNTDPADPSVFSSDKQTKSGPSTGPNPSPAGASNCYVNRDDIRMELPQSPAVHQVVNLNLSIVASPAAAPLAPSGASTPRPNGRPREMDSELPLSQEEVDVSSPQTEQGKEAHTAVPETGEFVC